MIGGADTHERAPEYIGVRGQVDASTPTHSTTLSTHIQCVESTLLTTMHRATMICYRTAMLLFVVCAGVLNAMSQRHRRTSAVCSMSDQHHYHYGRWALNHTNHSTLTILSPPHMFGVEVEQMQRNQKRIADANHEIGGRARRARVRRCSRHVPDRGGRVAAADAAGAVSVALEV